VIDLHCHMLPGVDDGAPDLVAGLALARAAVANGIQIAVLTPHVFPGRWNNCASNLVEVFDRFRVAVADADIPIQLRLGAEVHLLPESLKSFEAGEVPTLGSWNDRKVILLELPDGAIPVGALKAVDYLLKRGAVPMLAHPERNKDVMRSLARLRPFVDAGCLIQLTAASVCGWFGAAARRSAREILDAGWATAVATDAHNLRHRPPVLAEARQVLTADYGEDFARQLTVTHPLAIVTGQARADSLGEPTGSPG